MSYQQCTRFRTTLDFGREYLWNGSSNRQAENSVINYDVFHVRWKQFGELWYIKKKWSWPMSLKFHFIHAVVKVHVRAKYHQESGSWVTLRTEKKLRRKQYCSSLPWTVIVHTEDMISRTRHHALTQARADVPDDIETQSLPPCASLIRPPCFS